MKVRKSISVDRDLNDDFEGDLQVCENYRGIKLLSHAMKLWERVIEKRIRRETVIREMIGANSNNRKRTGRRVVALLLPGECDFSELVTNRRSASGMQCSGQKVSDESWHMWDDSLLWLWTIMLRSVDVRRVMAFCGTTRRFFSRLVATYIHTSMGMTESFLIKVGLHEGSALSPFIFTVIMEEISNSILETIPWCMLFNDNIVLVAETKEEANSKLEEWRGRFGGGTESIEKLEVTIGGEVVACTFKFKYLGSMIQSNGEIDGDVTNRIQAG
ncbi:uncharacterized protein LOC130810734 [Amaranthus tricolor]|uniref:uncharacterized protein LOC130810734 n=1 Tax=Amaranthus tricolor TaxID=29722 RepID=UPI0025887B36|nr:uncharacterized protein LOC130810734 [Amaranthus tricolor]